MAPHTSGAMQHDVRHEFAVLTHLNIRTDNAIRPNTAGTGNPGVGIDDGRGVDERRIFGGEFQATGYKPEGRAVHSEKFMPRIRLLNRRRAPSARDLPVDR